MAQKTEVSPMKIRQGNRLMPPAGLSAKIHESEIIWQKESKPKHTEILMKNLAVASALVLCALTLRSGALPALNQPADIALAAAADHSLIDEQLGKLSFVSSLFPEAVLVFGEQHENEMSLTVNADDIVHAWSEAEPYLAWQADTAEVHSAIEGEVSGVYHGNGEELIVRVNNEDGISCIYGNLAQVCVRTGDAVTKGTILGVLPVDQALILEVFKHGISIDPASCF